MNGRSQSFDAAEAKNDSMLRHQIKIHSTIEVEDSFLDIVNTIRLLDFAEK